jgi:hypothetical protein
MTRIGLGSLLLVAASAAWSGAAHAQSDANSIPAARNVSSPERFILELRGGPYQPDLGKNNAFDSFFGGDSGPQLGMQISYITYRLPNILYVTAGGGFAWSHYSGRAFAVDGTEVTEKTALTLLPLSAVGTVRIDALPRLLGLPFIFAGKIGWQWTHWDTDTGARTDATGWSMGLLYGAQFAIDLDSFDTSAARRLDEEWGINHSYAFFEVYRFSPTSSSLPVGGTGWVLGLGFNF